MICVWSGIRRWGTANLRSHVDALNGNTVFLLQLVKDETGWKYVAVCWMTSG